MPTALDECTCKIQCTEVGAALNVLLGSLYKISKYKIWIKLTSTTTLQLFHWNKREICCFLQKLASVAAIPNTSHDPLELGTTCQLTGCYHSLAEQSDKLHLFPSPTPIFQLYSSIAHLGVGNKLLWRPTVTETWLNVLIYLQSDIKEWKEWMGASVDVWCRGSDWTAASKHFPSAML